MRLRLRRQETRTGGRRPLTRATPLIAALALAFQSFPAAADMSFTVSALSDYRYRGPSLTHGRPSMKLNADYDSTWGPYAGAQVAGVYYGDDTQWEAELLGYAGYAWRIGDGRSVEVGVADFTFTRQHDYDFRDWYVGLASDTGWSGRMHYSRAYYGLEASAVYLELDKSHRLSPDLALFAHAGVLHLFPDAAMAPAPKDYFDARVGFALDVHRMHVEIAWVATNASSVIVTDEPRRFRQGPQLVVSATF
jgi:uncharacterized protein (TIGR02001 family)